MIMIFIGIIFASLRESASLPQHISFPRLTRAGVIGTTTHNAAIVDVAFDILALEALFMVPRIFSFLSLSPYWGTLIPCFKEMGKDFLKFMVFVVVIYLGFLTTFSLVSRNTFSFSRITMILTKIFFGSSGVGIEVMNDIDLVFGPPLMLLFICLSSFLLTGSLTGMLSNSFSRVIGHAREEYLYVYSVYVLEASTSSRLTHFMPPLNLISLVVFRPLRLFLHSDNHFRAGRIVLLRITHAPVVVIIRLYEAIRGRDAVDEFGGFKGPRLDTHGAGAPPRSESSGATAVEEGKEVEGEGMAQVEARMADMSDKIERLTNVVLEMQRRQQAGP